MATKTRLINAIYFGCAEVARFADHLADDQRNTLSASDEWNVRDLLAHVIESMHQGAERLTADTRGEPVEVIADNDAHNAKMIADYRLRTWDDLCASLDAALPEYLALVEMLSEEQLNDPQRHPRLQGRPIWRNIAGNVMSHPLAFHLRPWYIAHGDVEYATQQAKEEARLSLELGDGPEWTGNVLYNLACHYALSGNKKAALDNLREALKLAPIYAEYARGDTDFTSMRGIAEFEALLIGQALPG